MYKVGWNGIRNKNVVEVATPSCKEFITVLYEPYENQFLVRPSNSLNWKIDIDKSQRSVIKHGFENNVFQ